MKEVKGLTQFVLSDSEKSSIVPSIAAKNEEARVRLQEEIRREVFRKVPSGECDGTK